MNKNLRMVLTQFKTSKAYWFDFLTSLAVFPVYAALTYFLWKELIANGFSISLHDIFSYYVVMFFTGRIIHAGDCSRIISRQVVKGMIAYWLIRPMSYFSNLLNKRTGTMFFIFLTSFPIFLATSMLVPLNITTDLLVVLLYLFSLFLGFLLSLMFYFALGLSALWIEENWGLMWMARLVQNFLAGSWIPLYLFPEAIKNALLLLPFKYMGYFQVMLLQGKIPYSSLLQEFVVMFSWIIVFYVLMGIAWRIGRKHIEGHGV